MQVSSIGVVGAGQMGAGIAQVSACAGFSVTLVDIKADVIESGIASIRSSLARIVSKGRLDQKTSDEALDRIQTSLDLGDLAECDLVVEAIPEVLDLKTSTFNRLDAICKPSTILASNTSSISINTIAEFTSRPERVIGMHFMNPVPIMKLVEVINGTHTTEIVTSEVISVIEALGKTPLQCNDSPGFVSNRILCPMINEAIITLDEGVAEVEAIDGIMKLGMNHPIGPLALADLIGLDTVLNIMRVLHEGLGEEKYAPSPLLVSMVSEGKLGRKTKIGFYKY
ncbi:MAG: 3-hydroxyacyl-CoA dehydrogenase NAD-binding domain-containing protein [Candidatus Thermoplasmatota archaeon]|jgi:3-hydroxybutyryl-CoA dehydrogenase|nr:3-hydroxyacyl-CoA dehydrogenase NAD-binding domain-containing protein [Candidatus Thermoplasmatota archaeon]|tara:strand:- start:5089 stop:5937 length:849 start_codon:yes stop_codon:yes gene_type:complete